MLDDESFVRYGEGLHLFAKHYFAPKMELLRNEL